MSTGKGKGEDLWPMFPHESLFESLVNHYGLDMRDEDHFREWMSSQFDITDVRSITSPRELLILFRFWAAIDAEWVGAFSSHLHFKEKENIS